MASRPKKLAEAIKKHKVKVPQMTGFANEKEFLESLSDNEITELFDELERKIWTRHLWTRLYLSND